MDSRNQTIRSGRGCLQVGAAEQVAGLFAFLASEAGAEITGAAIPDTGVVGEIVDSKFYLGVMNPSRTKVIRPSVWANLPIAERGDAQKSFHGPRPGERSRHAEQAKPESHE